MNVYKKRDIINHVQSQGRLPTDAYGQVLPVNDLLVWYGLDQLLSHEEREIMKKEFTLLAESEFFMDQLRS